MNENTFCHSFFFRFDDSFFFCFNLFVLFFFFSLHFCILSHFEIIRCIVKLLIATLTYFFVEIQLKKRKLEKCFLGARVWAPKPIYWSPKQPEYITVDIQLAEGVHMTLPPHFCSVQVKSGACYITDQRVASSE